MRPDHFRPDVEGLRAVAVLLVLLCHAQVPFFGGGYVGVDVFFVISGFLITGLLLRELDSTGKISFTGFYARRVRRLLPASALTLLVTLGASVLLLSPVRIPSVTADIASAAAYVSNFRFGIAANDYFAANAAPSPVLHFWSLSVEEQFYFVWPSVLLILFAVSSRLHVGRRGLFVGMALLSAASLVGCVWLTGENQAWAFYLLPTRAWELGLGALLAISAGRLPLPGRWTSTGLIVLGVAAIALPAVLFSDSTSFPGFAAILPVAGAGLVILGGSRASFPARVLSLPPATFLGRISYSVYLWHWPMLLFAGVLYGTTLPLPLSVLVALASIPVAAITQRLVEQPFRLGRFIGTRPRVNLGQAVASALVLAMLAGGASVYATSEVDATLGDLIPPVADSMPMIGGWCLTPGEVDNMSSCVYGDLSSDVTVVLFGDSHAEQWFPALQSIATSRGWRLVTLTGRCPSLMLTTADPQFSNKAACEAWREHAFTRIAAERPALVILANFARQDLEIDGATVVDRATVIREWGRALSATLDRLKGMSAKVAIIGETPLPGVDVPTCLSLHLHDFDACAKPAISIPAEWHDSDRSDATQVGADFIDPTPWLCNAADCPAVIGDYIVYRDISHLTQPFVASLAPELDAALSPLVAGDETASHVPRPVASTPELETWLTDTFGRTVSAGWGQPEVGPAWMGDNGEDVSVDGMAGRMSVGAAGDGRFVWVPVTGTDVAVSGRWALDALPVGAPAALHFWPRVVDGSNYYGFYATVDPAGDVFASFTVIAGGQTSVIAGPTLVASGYAPGDWWWVRAEASGVNPTSLRTRVWKDGTAEPSTWTQELTDPTAPLQVSGNAVQVGLWNSAGETTLPFGARFDDVTIEAYHQ